MISAATADDSQLVGETLSGNRDAFAKIVSRYQSLICSLAYSATGSLGQSEDLAQETFITAWKHLRQLREREKLRPWLCGIARNRINNFLRREGRQPLRQAAPLEEISESPAPAPLPDDYVISKEEAEILWRSLEKIPEIYREPLVLFYREHQSIETVAAHMELSEDAVKQRLSRGRKLLQEQVLAFVEGALARTNPTQAFTFSVLSALPATTVSVKAATVAATLAKGGAAAKGALTVGTFASFFALVGGAYFSFMAQVDDSKSPRERQFMLQMFGKRICVTFLFIAGFLLMAQMDLFKNTLPAYCAVAVFGFLATVYACLMVPRYIRKRQQIQIEDNTFDPAEWMQPRKVTDAARSADKRSKVLKALKYMAFGLVVVGFVIFQESWKQNFQHAMLLSVYMLVALLWGFLRWQNRPRFQSFRNSILILPVLAGLITLAAFNWHQYLAQSSFDIAQIVSPQIRLLYNLTVVAAYAGFAAFLLWKRRQSSARI